MRGSGLRVPRAATVSPPGLARGHEMTSPCPLRLAETMSLRSCTDHPSTTIDIMDGLLDAVPDLGNQRNYARDSVNTGLVDMMVRPSRRALKIRGLNRQMRREGPRRRSASASSASSKPKTVVVSGSWSVIGE